MDKVSEKKTGAPLRQFKGFKEELKKVSWTSQGELVLCTKIVLGATFFFGMGIYVIDLLSKNGIDLLHKIGRVLLG